MSNWFACEIEEIVKPAGAKTPSVRRLDRGFAITEGSESRGFRIEASSEPFDETLRELDALLEHPASFDIAVPDNVSARILTRGTANSTGTSTSRSSLSAVILASNGISIVATPVSFATDLAKLVNLAGRNPDRSLDSSSLPIAWHDGSAAVLLHEAVGHPAERGLFEPDLAEWLLVDDDPSSGDLVHLNADDTGAGISRARLSDRERPGALRRWSHRDIPARRMTNLIATGLGQPLASLPSTRIDVLLVAHGYWDPGTDTVGVRVVAADLVDGPRRQAIRPFVYSVQRKELPGLLGGWFGPVTRHPGVLCGDEGVLLPVGSAAVGLVTEAR